MNKAIKMKNGLFFLLSFIKKHLRLFAMRNYNIFTKVVESGRKW